MVKAHNKLYNNPIHDESKVSEENYRGSPGFQNENKSNKEREMGIFCEGGYEVSAQCRGSCLSEDYSLCFFPVAATKTTFLMRHAL